MRALFYLLDYRTLCYGALGEIRTPDSRSYILYMTSKITCLHCGVEHQNPKFCSKSCAASYNNATRAPRSPKSRQKTSAALKGRKNPAAKNPELHPRWCKVWFHRCAVCQKAMSNPKRKTCSPACRDSICSKNGTLKQRIEYNGRVFQSYWEVDIAKFLDQHQIPWEQPNTRLQWYDTTLQRSRTYLPDFYLPERNVYIDVKNPLKQKQDADKLRQLKSIFPLVVGNKDDVKRFIMAGAEGLEPPTKISTTFEA